MREEPTTPDLEAHAQRLELATNTRDFDALVDHYARDAEIDNSGGGLGSLTGRTAIRGFFEDWIGAYEEYTFEFEEMDDLGGGVVLGIANLRGRLPGSNAWVQLRYAAITTFKDGLIEHQTNYTDIDRARAAAERLAKKRVGVSQANVALVQRGYDLWNAGQMEAAKVMFAPDLVMTTPPDWPDAITSSSRDEAFARLVENRSLFQSDRLVPEQWIEAGNCVIVPTQWCGVPKGASAEVKVFVVPVFTVRGESIVRLDWYGSVQQALDAVEQPE